MVKSRLLECTVLVAFVFFLGLVSWASLTLGTLKYGLRKAASPGFLPWREKAACASEEPGDMEQQ